VKEIALIGLKHARGELEIQRTQLYILTGAISDLVRRNCQQLLKFVLPVNQRIAVVGEREANESLSCEPAAYLAKNYSTSKSTFRIRIPKYDRLIAVGFLQDV
jgi:hypothetical protein